MTADVPGLDCAQSCTTTWNAATRLALTAVPRPGAKLVRWGGACSGASTCAVDVAPGATVSAVFAPSVFRLTATVAGRGAVRSSSAGITCRPKCSASFPSFVPLAPDRHPGEGLEVPLLVGRVPRHEAHVHRSDDRRDERARRLRSRLRTG